MYCTVSLWRSALRLCSNNVMKPTFSRTQCSPESGQCTLLPRRYDVGNWTMDLFKGEVKTGRFMFPGNAQCNFRASSTCTSRTRHRWRRDELDRATPLPPNWLLPRLQRPLRGQFWWWDQQKPPLANMYSDDLICSSRNPED